MSKYSLRDFDFQAELLNSINDNYETKPSFNACLNAHGMYETMRFVLRLSPRNHELMQIIETNGFGSDDMTPELVQAYSTYIHETIHWWQHVGSTSGLLFSLSYLAQSHSTMEELRNVIDTIGAKKPLLKYTDQVLLKEGQAAQTKLASANIAVNNALDVEFYKSYAYSPKENIKWMSEEPYFESVGHGYFIVYGQLVGMLSSVIDPDYEALPNAECWESEIVRLKQEQVEGFYWGSPVRLPAVGIRAIYEGQARFIQLQFLDGAQKKTLSCAGWKELGYLSGIYVEAFEVFLKLSESEWPKCLEHPLVALFLLVCDLAINPTRGMPIEIESFEDFIFDVDVGVRFTRLCLSIKELPHLKQKIKNYSKSEYIEVSEELSKINDYDNPMDGLAAVLNWLEKAPGLLNLMKEYETFEYKKMNLPIRVFLSHFVAFCKDKFEHPEFFCWPGIYLSGEKDKFESHEMWLRHLSLFSDRGDKTGVYPRNWPNRSKEAVMDMFQSFYGTMMFYDLTRQWILEEGPFVFDFSWLMENYEQADVEEWGNNTLNQVFGVSLNEFEIIQ